MTREHPELPTPPTPPQHEEAPAPVLQQPRWSGKKTAVVAALAIGLSSAGAITATAAVASGTGGGTGQTGSGFGNARRFDGFGGAGSWQQGGGLGQGGTNSNSTGVPGSTAARGNPPGAGDATP